MRKGSSGDGADTESFTHPHSGSGKRKCGRDKVRTMLSSYLLVVLAQVLLRPWGRGQKTLYRCISSSPCLWLVTSGTEQENR